MQHPVGPRTEFEDEESNMILTDLFFNGRLELKWNTNRHSLMLKPEIEIRIKALQSARPSTECNGQW